MTNGSPGVGGLLGTYRRAACQNAIIRSKSLTSITIDPIRTVPFSMPTGPNSRAINFASVTTESETLSKLLHPLDLLLDDFGLADVASRVEAPRDERESLLGDRLGLLQVPGDSYDCEGSRRGRVQMPALPLYARKEELRPRLRTRAVAHGDDVLAHGRLGRELHGGWEVSRRDTAAEIEEIALADRQDVH